MAKKNPTKKIFENMPVESAETEAEKTESVQANPQGETLPSEPDAEKEVTETPTGEEQSSSEPSMVTADEQEPSAEDLLEDVRQSLIQEEAEKPQKDSKWWRRIGKKTKKAKNAEPQQPAANLEIDLPVALEAISSAEVQEQKREPEQDIDEIDDLIDMLKAESEAETVESASAPEVQAPPEPAVDFEKLKEQAFRPRTPQDEPESDVRSVALEGGEEVFVEVQSQVSNPLEERLSAVENVFRPYRRYIYTALALLGVGMAVFASLIIYNVIQQSRPEPVREVSNLPYPTAVSLPGGWSFQLGRGTLQAGKWDPNGAEWLEGTEVCRWVALPWSLQLEAVIRTLNPKDPIELVMSNNDKLIYEVYSVRQLTPEQMQELDSNSPCLLLILTQSDSEERWVLTAVP
jgi:hypothetical protein